ncbi:MAG TPA: ABC transporter permease subunit [Acholeplasmataceae bacterium]|jgi:putative exporter of polyketide antibiotics|nr:ABC transporter permease subunit [Acholeplasmataceae bacterium]
MINFQILKMELKRYFKSLLGWSLSIGIFLYIVIILYPMVKDLYNQLSGELLELLENFGGLPKNEIEYFATEGGMLLQLFGAVYAAFTGFNLISREEREQTTDAVFSLPVSRTSFFFTKLIVAFIQMLLFTIFIMLCSFLGFISISSNLDFSRFFIYMAIYLLLLLVVVLLGMSLACFLKRSSKSAIALVIPLPLYLLTLFSSLVKNDLLKKLKYLSPFTFSDPITYLKLGESFEYISFLVTASISIILTIIGLFLYRKREFTN